MYPKILRGVPSELRNDIAPDGMENTRLYRNFAWLRMKFCAIQGISVAKVDSELMLFVVSSQGSGMRTLVDKNLVVQDETSRTAD